MEITFTGRHREIPEAAKSYLSEKLERFIKNIPKVNGVHVIFDLERYQHKVEVVILLNRVRIRAAEKTEDVMASIDKVLDKIERQLKKYKEKLQYHRTRERDIPSSDGESPVENEEEVETSVRLVRTKKFAPKPMYPDEAMDQLKLSEDIFLTFFNPETDGINVIYKRKDGNFGLIETAKKKV
ncbi:MAG: ribosome-associated translation inhibitor RaiA [Chlamydiae bacterium]|nr:ribosome-associated translation inhibitor RaiA [Chlamydiota bacterium]MBI3277643.1 ribosome-associated translation inhibitor RaiA [Chlamydiota bacterium]